MFVKFIFIILFEIYKVLSLVITKLDGTGENKREKEVGNPQKLHNKIKIKIIA